MPDQAKKPSLPSQAASHTQPKAKAEGATRPEEIEQLHNTIDTVLHSVHRQQQALRQVKDAGHNTEIAQQKIQQITTLHSEVQQLLETATQLDKEVVSEALEKDAHVKTQLDKLSALWEQDNEKTPTGRALKKYLHGIIFHLQDILSDINTALEELSTIENPQTLAQPFQGKISREQVVSLLKKLEQERQLMLVSDLGQSRKAAMLMQLHQMTLIIYRLRALSLEPRMSQRIAQIESIALQAKDTVDTVDISTSNVLEVLDSSLSALDRQLCKLEYSRRFMPGASWCINRYRDVTRLKSVPARVLSGLGLSLALSGLMFATAATILSALSTYASYSQNSLRKRQEEKQTELLAAVDLLQEQEQQNIILEIQIEEKEEQIRTRENASQIIETGKLEPTPSADGEAVAIPPLSQTSASAKAQSENEADEPSPTAPEQTSQLSRLVAERIALQQTAADLKSELQVTNNTISQISEDLRAASSATIETQGNWILRANFLNSQGLLDHTMRVILAAFSGLVGSMMSILIRLDQLEKETINNPFLLGALKPLIGAVFGIAGFAILSTGVIDILPASFQLRESPRVPIAQESAGTGTITKKDPLGELDSQEVYKIFLVAFIAGFSERLANDTLKSVSSSRASE